MNRIKARLKNTSQSWFAFLILVKNGIDLIASDLEIKKPVQMPIKLYNKAKTQLRLLTFPTSEEIAKKGAENQEGK